MQTNTKTERIMKYISAIAAILAVVIFRRNWGAELHLFKSLGFLKDVPIYASTPEQWLQLFTQYPLVGVTSLNLFDVINSFLIMVLTFGMYLLFNKENKIASKLFLISSIISFLLYIGSNQALSMLHLSKLYEISTNAVEQEAVYSAALTILLQDNPGNMTQGLTAHAALFFLFLSGFIVSMLMIKSDQFKSFPAILGIIAHGLGVPYFLFLLFIPKLAAIPLVLSAPCIITWYTICAIKLLKTAK